MKPDIEALLAVARAATQEEWERGKHPQTVVPKGASFDTICTVQVSNVPDWPENATHIATFNPAAMISLLTAFSALEDRVGVLEGAAEAGGRAIVFLHEQLHVTDMGETALVAIREALASSPKKDGQ